MKIPITVGDRIKEQRNKKGLSQEELAKALGVGRSLVWRWEHGTIASVRRSNLESLSKVLGCSIEYLQSGYQQSVLPYEVEAWLRDPKNAEKIIKFYYDCMAEEKTKEAIDAMKQKQ